MDHTDTTSRHPAGTPDPRSTARPAPHPVASSTSGDDVVRATIWVHGRCHGVGFRWWTRARALELGLVGFARNAAGGRVEVFAQGPRDNVEELIRLLEEKPSTRLRPGEVTSCITTWGPTKDELEGFVER